jgi:hypothetical protein
MSKKWLRDDARIEGSDHIYAIFDVLITHFERGGGAGQSFHAAACQLAEEIARAPGGVEALSEFIQAELRNILVEGTERRGEGPLPNLDRALEMTAFVLREESLALLMGARLRAASAEFCQANQRADELSAAPERARALLERIALTLDFDLRARA